MKKASILAEFVFLTSLSVPAPILSRNDQARNAHDDIAHQYLVAHNVLESWKLVNVCTDCM